MDKNGSLTIKFSGKETLDLQVLSKLCSSLLNILNKISLVSSNKKNDYSVSYNDSDGFSLIISQDSSDVDSILDSEVNGFNTFIDLLLMRRFIARSGKFTCEIKDDLSELDNTLEKESFSLKSYNIYTSDNVIEDNLAKLSSLILNKKNSFQCIYKNGILEKRVNYSKEDLESTARKINLENLITKKEDYNLLMALEVEQLDLLGNSNWKFKDLANKTNSFKAKIKDKEFTSNLKSGNVIIGYGLILKGDVKMTIVKDKYGKIIPSKSSYIIEKVHDVLYKNQADLTTLNID